MRLIIPLMSVKRWTQTGLGLFFGLMCANGFAGESMNLPDKHLFSLSYELKADVPYSTGWQRVEPSGAEFDEIRIYSQGNGCRIEQHNMYASSGYGGQVRLQSIAGGIFNAKGIRIDGLMFEFMQVGRSEALCTLHFYGVTDSDNPTDPTDPSDPGSPDEPWDSRESVREAANRLSGQANLFRLQLMTTKGYASVVSSARNLRHAARDIEYSVKEGATYEQAMILYKELEALQANLARDFYRVHAHILDKEVEAKWWELQNNYQRLRDTLNIAKILPAFN